MKTKIIGFVLSVAFFATTTAMAAADWATKERGWHKGAYILGSVGFLNVDEDTHVQTGAAFGSDIILAYGLTFGWNFLDFLAIELQTRYGSEKQGNQREHAANINMNLKYSFIFDALTRSENIRFLPYAKMGGGVFGAAVPDTSAGNDRFGVYGPLFDFGIGMEMLIRKIFYVGLDFTQDFVFLQEKSKNNQKILNGGFDPQYSVTANFGIHF